MTNAAAPAFRRRNGFLLATLGRRAESAWTSFLRGQSLTNAEFSALAVLADQPVGQGQLAGYLAIDPRNASSLVRKLEQRGWVVSRSDSGDARRRIISLTAEGLDVWLALQSQLASSRSGYFDALDQQEQEELQRLLNKLNDAHLRQLGSQH